MADADFSVKAIISAQTSQFEKGIKNAQSSINTMSKSIEGVQKLLKSAFSVVGIGVTIKAVTDFGRSCVQSATQAQKAFNILDNTVKATGADAWTSIENLESASKALSNSTNYSVTEIQKMQSVLLGFTNITGEAFDEASEAVLDMATVMGMDLTSAVQTIGKALDDPITGLDSLRRQGFKFTGEQKAELTQLVKNGKQLEAQKIILDTLATSYGGAAKAGQDSFAKQRHAVENFRDTLGGKLIPVMQVFAENSAKTLNNLTNLISNMDFTPVVNVVTNLSKIFSSTFEKISNYLRSVKDEVTDFISRFNFKPIISVLDTLVGTFVTEFDRIKSRFNESSNMFNQLKESLIDFSNSEMFQKIVDVINSIIDAIVFLWGEIERVAGEIRAFIVGKVIEIWNKIKELFNNSQEALANSESDIKSWGDYFYSIFNNIFRIAQDLINSVSALLNGNWQVAWEYAKLAVLRVAESVATTLESIKNGFKDKMQEMLSIASLAVKFLPGGMGIALSTALKGLEKLTDNSSKMRSVIQEQVEETENKIQELTGHTADVAIKDLKGVSTTFAGFTSSALGAIEDLTEGTEEAIQKTGNHFQTTTSTTENAYEKFSEWDSKLLQQRLEGLSDWSDEAHKINLQLIEEERKKALEADKTGAETEKINKYYNKQIEKENERSEKAKRDKIIETMKVTVSTISNIAKKTIETFKKVVSAVKDVFSKMKNIFSFNVDDALDNLLRFEDSILTFFVETLPKLPSFFASAIESIIRLFDSLITSINWGRVQEIINTIIDVIVKNAPTIIDNLLTVIINIAQTLINGFIHFVESGGWKMLLDLLLSIQKKLEQFVIDNIDSIVQTIVDMLPDLVQFLIDSVVSASKTLSRLIKPIIKLIIAIIEAIFEFLLSDEVLDAGIEVIMSLIDAINEELIPQLSKLIPKLIVKVIGFIVKNLPKLVKAIVEGLIKSFSQLNWFEIIKECFMGFIEGFKDLFGIHSPSTLFEGFGNNIVQGLVNGLKGISEAVLMILQPLAELIQGLFSGLFSSIENIAKISIGGLESLINTSFSGLVNMTNTLNSGMVAIINALNSGIIGINNSIVAMIDSVRSLIAELNNISIPGFSGGGGGGSSGGGSSKREWYKVMFDPGNFFWHANGTNNAPRGLSIVGEAGPELVKFRGGEQVLNAHNTQKALEGMGGNTNNFNVTFNNLQDTSAFAMLQQLKQYNRQMAINGVL